MFVQETDDGRMVSDVNQSEQNELKNNYVKIPNVPFDSLVVGLFSI